MKFAFGFFFTAALKVEAHIGVHGFGRRGYGKDAKGFFKIFLVLFVTVLLIFAAHC